MSHHQCEFRRDGAGWSVRDRAQAEEAVARLRAAGVAEEAVHLDEGLDYVASLRSEMHDELTNAWVVPNAAVAYTKESAHGLATAVVIGVGIGLALAFPMALIPLGHSHPMRLLVWAVVGMAFGATVALVAGPALGTRRPDEPSAAQRGTVVRVEQDTAQLRSLLAELGPIRLDEITAAGDPIATVTTEGPSGPVEQEARTLRDMADNAVSDDYHVADHDRSTRR